MEKESKGHWTSDEALVESFVLNRLQESQRAMLESHLRECETCRDVVAREMNVAATIRMYGREVLKDRLRESVASSATRTAPWPHIASVAAVALIVIGLGVYEGWFVSENEVSEEGETSPAPALKMESPPAGGEVARPEEGPRLGAARDDRQKKSVPPSDLGAPADREESITRFRLDEGARARRGEGAAFSDRLWIDGIVLDEKKKELRYAAPESARQRKLEKLDAAAAEGTASREKTGTPQTFSVVHRDVRQTISLNQQARGQLPADQQLKEKDYDQDRIPTLLERTDSGLSITIYSDDLAQTEQGATVEPVSVDSLVVGIGEKKIGYRIPGGWGQDSKLKGKK